MLDPDCKTCDRGGYTVRVTGGDLAGDHHESLYACDECAPIHAADMRRRFADVEIKDLPNRPARPTPEPTLFDFDPSAA